MTSRSSFRRTCCREAYPGRGARTARDPLPQGADRWPRTAGNLLRNGRRPGGGFGFATTGARAEGPVPAPGVKIVRKSPALDALIAKDAVVEKLADGYQWTEGPVWDKAGGRLLFSDIPGNRIIAWAAGKGASEWLKPSGYTGTAPFTGREPGSNGLAFDGKGHLILCQHGDRRIARREASGKFTTLTDRHDGKRLNSPNDLVFTANGESYFTDPPYGLPGTSRSRQRTALLRRLPAGADGKVTLLTKEMTAPNGIGLSPDEKTLYVANSDPKRRSGWPIPCASRRHGRRRTGLLRCDLQGGQGAARLAGRPQGRCRGQPLRDGAGGRERVRPGGERLGTIETGVPTANCGFGDDGRTLYITANTALLRVRTLTKGQGF